MLGSLYKLLAKLLSRRPEKVMEKIISDCLGVFVNGRQILDSPLIANKYVDEKKRNLHKLLCQLDMEKPYDHIN